MRNFIIGTLILIWWVTQCFSGKKGRRRARITAKEYFGCLWREAVSKVRAHEPDK